MSSGTVIDAKTILVKFLERLLSSGHLHLKHRGLATKHTGIQDAGTCYENAITLTAKVISANATETVTFYDGTTSLGTGALSSGVASLSVSTLAVGTHTLYAA